MTGYGSRSRVFTTAIEGKRVSVIACTESATDAFRQLDQPKGRDRTYVYIALRHLCKPGRRRGFTPIPIFKVDAVIHTKSIP